MVPIYEYRCPDGHTFELLQRMSDPPAEVCEVCGKGPVTKVMHPVPVFFKGSGFYSTDYGRKGKKRDSTDSDAPKKDDVKKVDAKSAEKKSETKTEKKTEPSSSSRGVSPSS